MWQQPDTLRLAVYHKGLLYRSLQVRGPAALEEVGRLSLGRGAVVGCRAGAPLLPASPGAVRSAPTREVFGAPACSGHL